MKGNLTFVALLPGRSSGTKLFRLIFLIGLPFLPAGSAAQQTLALRNSSGVYVAIDSEDSNPALTLVVPDGPEHERSSKILFPEHVTVRAHGESAQQHLHVFRPGRNDLAPRWTKSGNTLQYEEDFGEIHLVARATLVNDGIVFRYEFVNRSATDYDMATAVTDPRFQGIFHDPRLERTWVHHSDGFDLLASESPSRLTMPLEKFFPARYHASYTVPVPAERIQRRDDGITYYYKSRPVDVPMIATLSTDRAWIVASFARAPGNVWTNPELTCQHVDPEVSLPHGARRVYEVKILIFKGSLQDALKKVQTQRGALR
jgi:hypothetical protein